MDSDLDKLMENDSDLPEDQTTVLLLGVTRIPTSPIPPRRPCSLPLESPINPRKITTAQQRRNSFTTRRHHHQITCRNSSTTSINSNYNNNNNNKRRQDNNLNGKWTSGEGVVDVEITGNDTENITKIDTSGIFVEGGNNKKTAIMDTSVDSIGNCSLDIEASADLSDLSEASSTATLRSGGSLKISPADQQHLPSYLSLACTVNGYSTTTNYDPERLARSRDVSPHRPQIDNVTIRNIPSYTIQNNLLSPPNLVPLPILIKPTIKMNDTNKTTFMSKELRTQTTTTTTIKHNFYEKDTVDACYENGHSNKILTINGDTETTIKQFHHTEIQQSKSIVQQRIERLYGPGALAQSFFAVKRQSNTFNELNKSFHEKNKENIKNGSDNNKTSTNGAMKQSNSNPTLPVLKHLRAEFRAQLPINNKTYKCNESTMQKSNTVPILKDDGDNNNSKINGHSEKQIQGTVSEGSGIEQTVIADETGADKDGHYFIKILQGEADRLLKQADNVEIELAAQDLPEEIVGKIRSAAGKARLLVSQKMQQFKGLCTNNITQVDGEAFPTTNADLQGFWDMVMLQVDQVDALFKEIADLKANNWQEIDTKKSNGVNGKTITTTTTKKLVNRTTRPPVSAASEELRKQREAKRKEMLEERRKAMKNNNKNKPAESIEIFVPESS